MLTHEQLKQSVLSWVNQPGRDLATELPSAIRTALEKHFLKMYFHADDAADASITALQAQKQLILNLKSLYPDVQP